MPKTMRVTMEIDVDDLPPDQRAEAVEMAMQEPPEELPSLADYSAEDIAEVLDNINEDTGAELFAGTDIYVRILECRVTDAVWK